MSVTNNGSPERRHITKKQCQIRGETDDAGKTSSSGIRSGSTTSANEKYFANSEKFMQTLHGSHILTYIIFPVFSSFTFLTVVFK